MTPPKFTHTDSNDTPDWLLAAGRSDGFEVSDDFKRDLTSRLNQIPNEVEREAPNTGKVKSLHVLRWLAIPAAAAALAVFLLFPLGRNVPCADFSCLVDSFELSHDDIAEWLAESDPDWFVSDRSGMFSVLDDETLDTYFYEYDDLENLDWYDTDY